MTLRSLARASALAVAVALGSSCASGPAKTAPNAAPAAARFSPMQSLPRKPVAMLDHKLPPAQITSTLEQAIADCDAALARVTALKDPERTFANTVEAMEHAVATFLDRAYRLQILKDIHPDADVRNAAAAVEEKSSQYAVKIGSRRDLYAALKGWQANAGKTESLDPQQARLLELFQRDFRRNGLELDDKGLARLVELRTRLASLSTEFSKHLNENTDGIEVTAAELEGVPASAVERLKPGKSGGRIVTTKYPDYYPFMENAKSGDARRRLYVAFNSREIDSNLPLLTEALKIRTEAAKLLGYATHADFVTDDRMAKSGARVQEFLASLATKLRPRRDADYAKLVELKRAETKDPNAKLEPWDVMHYLHELKKRDYTLDDEAIRQFFPADTVVAGMFGVYEDLFGIKLVPVKDADVWHPDVKLYEIRDRSSNELVAYFYADFYPRDGKYGHAAVAPLNVPREAGGAYVAPLALLMANFTPPSADRPSLLSHDEVKTLFHEFGHVVHQTLTRARFGSQAGFNVAGDFVEAPSQMLENWVYVPEVLDRLSGHYQAPEKKLPRETIAKIEAARMFDAGYRYTRQVFLASFDQAIHTAGGAVDVRAVEAKIYKDVLALEPVKETAFAASFGHLMGGYDAGYYGYLWSEVFAADMFTRFKQEGVLSPELGRFYRETILSKGRSIEPDALLQEFLGRPANDAAFLEKLGVK